MKHLILLLSILGWQIGQAQSAKYDSSLAKKLGADEYGMKSFVLVLLKSGSYTAKSKTESDSLFRGHMSNIQRLADEGKLVLAGPFKKNDMYRGLFLLDVKAAEEARALCASDPAVKANLFSLEIFPWYGSAAVMEIPEIHKKLENKSH